MERLCSINFQSSFWGTPHTTTNVSPSQLFLQRQLRTRFDLLKPDTKVVVMSKQANQKDSHDKHSKLRNFFPGEPVMVRDFRHSDKWITGTILKKLGLVTYSVEAQNGLVLKRYIDHLRQGMTTAKGSTLNSTTEDASIQDNFQYPEHQDMSAHDRPSQDQPNIHRYPQRDHRPPDRFMH